MFVHKVRCLCEKILNKLIGDPIVTLESSQVLQLDEAVLVHVDFFHDEKGNVAGHFREGERESRLVNVAFRENLADLWHDYDFEVAENQSTDLVCVDFREKLAWAHDRGSLAEWILHVLG